LQALTEVYRQEWMQQLFPFYSVQSFDLVELPRMPQDFAAFKQMLDPTYSTNMLRNLVRAWQLTNTRYLVAPDYYATVWMTYNMLQLPTPSLVTRFDFVPKPGISIAIKPQDLAAVMSDRGRFALFDFSSALPRAKLYAHWQTDTNDSAVLQQIFDPAFDPQSNVIVDGELPTAGAGGEATAEPAPVEFVRYAPKDVVLKATASAPSVLLLNDHYDPNWNVTVDGKPEELLRCNFLMRGVRLLPGNHVVEFRFQPPFGLLYVSLAALTTSLVALFGYLILIRNRAAVSTPSTPAPPAPALPPIKSKTNRKPDNRKKAAPVRSAKV
jgi:hypothetical protein